MQCSHGLHLRKQVPLIYPQIELLVRGTLCPETHRLHLHERHVHAEKNARIHPRIPLSCKSKDKVEAHLQVLLSEELMSAKDADDVRKGPKDAAKPVISPSQWMYWNVHLDGLERTHDLIVEREGVFKECILAMRMAKILGYQVATNTTIYKETDIHLRCEDMYKYLSALGIDGHTISPGYEYDAAKKDMISRLNLQPENFFLTRKMTIDKFNKLEEWCRKFNFFGTPIYFRIPRRQSAISTCSAWAIPTRNIRGWKGPCYLMTDGHFNSYAELLEKVQWDNYGVVDGVAKDVRCENCMVHCGYEPTASLGLNGKRGDTWKNIKYNFGAKPKTIPEGSEVNAYTGVGSGNGHLTGKKETEATPAPASSHVSV